MQRLLRLASAAILSVGMTSGAVMAGTGTIDTTGPGSDNEVKFEQDVDMDVENRNDVRLDNRSRQIATSGHARVQHNTTAGDAETGDAENDNWTSADLVVENSGSEGLCGCFTEGDADAHISNTGPDSDNEVKFEQEVEIDVENKNEVHVSNDSEQSAHTGNARVRYNTTGGSASSGSASNINTSEFSIRVSN